MANSGNPVKYVYAQQYKETPKPKSLKQIVIFLTVVIIIAITSFTLGVNIGKNQANLESSANLNPGPSEFPNQPFFRITAVDGKGRGDEVTMLITDKKIVYKDINSGKILEISATSEQVNSVTSFATSSSFQSLNNHYGLGCEGCLTYIFVAGDGQANSKTVITEWGINPEPDALAPFIKGFEELVIRLNSQSGS